MRAAAAHKGPVFLRAGRPKVPVIYEAGHKFVIGKSEELLPGTDVTIIATGLMTAEAIRSAQALEAENLSVRVVDIHTIKPLDREAIERAASGDRSDRRCRRTSG